MMVGAVKELVSDKTQQCLSNFLDKTYSNKYVIIWYILL